MRQIEITMQFTGGSIKTTRIHADEGAFHWKAAAGHGVIIALAVKAPDSEVEFVMPAYALDRT